MNGIEFTALRRILNIDKKAASIITGGVSEQELARLEAYPFAVDPRLENHALHWANRSRVFLNAIADQVGSNGCLGWFQEESDSEEMSVEKMLQAGMSIEDAVLIECLLSAAPALAATQAMVGSYKATKRLFRAMRRSLLIPIGEAAKYIGKTSEGQWLAYESEESSEGIPNALWDAITDLAELRNSLVTRPCVPDMEASFSDFVHHVLRLHMAMPWLTQAEDADVFYSNPPPFAKNLMHRVVQSATGVLMLQDPGATRLLMFDAEEYHALDVLGGDPSHPEAIRRWLGRKADEDEQWRTSNLFSETKPGHVPAARASMLRH